MLREKQTVESRLVEMGTRTLLGARSEAIGAFVMANNPDDFCDVLCDVLRTSVKLIEISNGFAAEEMAQQLRAPAAFPAPCLAAHKCPGTPAPGNVMPSADFHGHAYTWHAFTHIHTPHKPIRIIC